mmetsp:Transcript_54321/g.132723  ORF Transcript_54321/g.132723 Transcript_54321/m.132723 type:complete len:254 (-) Transcript_54321:836-1597(-)
MYVRNSSRMIIQSKSWGSNSDAKNAKPPPDKIAVRFETKMGTSLPSFSTLTSPYNMCVTVNHAVSDSTSPPTDPRIAPVAEQSFQSSANTIGTTAEPMKLPIELYRKLSDTSILTSPHARSPEMIPHTKITTRDSRMMCAPDAFGRMYLLKTSKEMIAATASCSELPDDAQATKTWHRISTAPARPNMWIAIAGGTSPLLASSSDTGRLSARAASPQDEAIANGIANQQMPPKKKPNTTLRGLLAASAVCQYA